MGTMVEHEEPEEMRRSKFEWRAEDVVILSPEQAARALAEEGAASLDSNPDDDGDPTTPVSGR